MPLLPTDTIETIIAEHYGGDVTAFKHELRAYLAQDRSQREQRKRVEPDTAVIIELKDVSRRYKLGRKHVVEAVKNASLRVHEGEIIALTGPSGSGKSTLMHLIGGLDKPSAGELIVNGNNLHRMSEGRLAQYRSTTIGFVFQFFYLQPFLNVAQNVEVPQMFARAKRAGRRQLIDETVSSVGLADRARHLPKELSGGQMQRVAIARALINRPKILLADEPTGNLDSTTSQTILELLQQIRKDYGTTMVIVTHDPKVASWADRVIRLKDGEVQL